MTVLEATVEIVKTVMSPGAQSSSTQYYVTDEESRKQFIEGLEAIYKKLEELEKDKKPVSRQN